VIYCASDVLSVCMPDSVDGISYSYSYSYDSVASGHMIFEIIYYLSSNGFFSIISDFSCEICGTQTIYKSSNYTKYF
jgi:hypothetical protein